MPRRRVVVTGLGPVTPIGTAAEGLWAGLRRERSAVRTLTRFDPELWRSRNAGEVADFDFGSYPNVARLIARMQARPAFEPTFAGFRGLVGFLAGQKAAA